MDAIRRTYLIIIFLTIIGLVFYFGYLHGYRESEAKIPAEYQTINSNGFFSNSLTNIEERPIVGVAVVNGQLSRQNFGKLYFQINSKNQTEIEIRIEGAPLTLTQPSQGQSVKIPDELSVEKAVSAIDPSDQLDTYEYINISPIDNKPAILRFAEVENGTRSARFSGILNRPITASNKLDIERIVLNSRDGTKNVFYDTDPNLPVKIRGNQDTTPQIPAQPAPFFWVDF
jgi:hypothetical protein